MSRAALLAKKQAEVAALQGADAPAAAAPVAAPVAAPTPVAAPVAPPVAAPVPAPAPVVAAAPEPIPSLVPEFDEPLWETPAAPVPAPAPAFDVSAVVAQANELASIKAQHEAARRELEELRKQAAAATQATPAQRKAAKDILAAEAWKSENVDHAVAVDLLDGFSPAIEAMIEERIRAATAPVQEQLQAQTTRAVEQRQRQFEAEVVQRVPHMKRILDDSRFSVFLSKPMPGAGLPYAEAFNRHVADQNPDGMAWVAAQFAAFTRAGTAAAAPAVAPASTAAEPPRAGGSAAASIQTQTPAQGEKPPTAEDFAKLKRDAVQKRITRDEFATKFAALRQRALQSGSTAGVH